METTLARQQLIQQYLQAYTAEAAQVLQRCSVQDIARQLVQQPLELQERILRHLSADVAGDVVETLPPEALARLIDHADAYTAAKVLSRTDPAFYRQLLPTLPARKATAIREALTYPTNAAGFLMDTHIVTFYPHQTVQEVLERLRNIGDRRVINPYVIDAEGHLLGKVFIQRIAISQPEVTLEELLEPTVRVEAMSPAEEAVAAFEQGNIINLPVVDIHNYLLGIIRSDTLIAETQKDASEDALAMFGAGREERALSSPWLAVRKRLPWLQINLVTAFLAASIVGIFEDVIAQVTVLAVFLPVVAGQSGNTGSQALAVTIRGLALREIQPRQWWQICRKEIVVGLVNGVAVALTTALVAYFWASSLGIALVIGSSMILSMIIASFSGAVVPIVLKSLGQDPAQSSSIVLTTVTDIMGFLSFLGLATLLGSALGIF